MQHSGLHPVLHATLLLDLSVSLSLSLAFFSLYPFLSVSHWRSVPDISSETQRLIGLCWHSHTLPRAFRTKLHSPAGSRTAGTHTHRKTQILKSLCCRRERQTDAHPGDSNMIITHSESGILHL